ncbi:ATP synthase I [Wenjunlia vitaminophila]|uniref:ATP synthase I n=1 Tax=Wenjunlia vitaminophila TaxID=76728 RepID=A0A0T6LTN5_WENVI|nr:hypothetical protein [Wenjunlia vitaminophila]KRV49469.1 ATP synthase I [Wenjunlia vitaminophila]
MQSNDARILLSAAVPTAAVGVVAIGISVAVAGSKGAIGAAFGLVLVLAFFSAGLVALQRSARSLPHLFQAMGMLVYTTQLLLLAIVLALVKDTEAFNPKAFAFTLIGCTVAWVAAQARGHMKAKILYVDPASGADGPAKLTEPRT